jgi:GntR family transcriptional regulator
VVAVIDYLTGVPAYRQLADLLRQRIASGEIPPRTPLPSTKTLAAEHSVAIGTVTKAIGVLRSEGLVITVPGRGVWVTEHAG